MLSCNHRRKEAQDELRNKLLAHKEIDAKVRNLRDQAKELKVDYEKTEDDLKALQSVGQIIGEVLRQLDEERCEYACTHLSACVFLRPACSACTRIGGTAQLCLQLERARPQCSVPATASARIACH